MVANQKFYSRPRCGAPTPGLRRGAISAFRAVSSNFEIDQFCDFKFNILLLFDFSPLYLPRRECRPKQNITCHAPLPSLLYPGAHPQTATDSKHLYLGATPAGLCDTRWPLSARPPDHEFNAQAPFGY